MGAASTSPEKKRHLRSAVVHFGLPNHVVHTGLPHRVTPFGFRRWFLHLTSLLICDAPPLHGEFGCIRLVLVDIASSCNPEQAAVVVLAGSILGSVFGSPSSESARAMQKKHEWAGTGNLKSVFALFVLASFCQFIDLRGSHQKSLGYKESRI